MNDRSGNEHQIHEVENFQQLISVPFSGNTNALAWKRSLKGNFSEIADTIEGRDDIIEIGQDELRALELSEQGQLARKVILEDLQLLKDYGAAPVLNLITRYERDASFFPTDVYSFHVDRSPIPTATFLCTYLGASSAILPNKQAEQKIAIPEVRAELKKLFHGTDEAFEAFLEEYFFDLHYQEKQGAQAINLGVGNLWKLAVDHPKSEVLPCIHRAPNEQNEKRLLLIC
ncbi:hypothetical protein N9L43_00530 [bacterium]|nr:hypothetical protein [bacterium]